MPAHAPSSKSSAACGASPCAYIVEPLAARTVGSRAASRSKCASDQTLASKTEGKGDRAEREQRESREQREQREQRAEREQREQREQRAEREQREKREQREQREQRGERESDGGVVGRVDNRA